MTVSRRFPCSRGLQQVAGIGVHAMGVSAVAMTPESAAALVCNGTRSACVLETLAIAHLRLVQRMMAAGRMTMSAKIRMALSYCCTCHMSDVGLPMIADARVGYGARHHATQGLCWWGWQKQWTAACSRIIATAVVSKHGETHIGRFGHRL